MDSGRDLRPMFTSVSSRSRFERVCSIWNSALSFPRDILPYERRVLCGGLGCGEVGGGGGWIDHEGIVHDDGEGDDDDDDDDGVMMVGTCLGFCVCCGGACVVCGNGRSV